MKNIKDNAILITIMGKSNVAESTANVAAEVAGIKTVDAVAAPVCDCCKERDRRAAQAQSG